MAWKRTRALRKRQGLLDAFKQSWTECALLHHPKAEQRQREEALHFPEAKTRGEHGAV